MAIRDEHRPDARPHISTTAEKIARLRELRAQALRGGGERRIAAQWTVGR
jgi:hypothetical protein